MGYQSPLPPNPGPTECLQEGLYANCSTVVLSSNLARAQNYHLHISRVYELYSTV